MNQNSVTKPLYYCLSFAITLFCFLSYWKDNEFPSKTLEVAVCLEWLLLLLSTGRSISKWINFWQLNVILLTKAGGGQGKNHNCNGFHIIRFKKLILKTRGDLESLWMTEMKIKCRYSFHGQQNKHELAIAKVLVWLQRNILIRPMLLIMSLITFFSSPLFPFQMIILEWDCSPLKEKQVLITSMGTISMCVSWCSQQA